MEDDSYYHLSQLQRELDAAEGAARSVERQMDRDLVHINQLTEENRDLVSQVQALSAQVSDIRQQIAEKIRAELVCCFIYDDDRGTSRAGRTHAICFWGEAAARLAEDREESDREGIEVDPNAPWHHTKEPAPTMYLDHPDRKHWQISPYIAGPGETIPAEFTGSGPMFPGQIGYRAGEHNRPKAPCFECVTNDDDPCAWCDCRTDEVCKGPCRQKAHRWDFHEQGCTHYRISSSASGDDKTRCPYCRVVSVAGEAS